MDIICQVEVVSLVVLPASLAVEVIYYLTFVVNIYYLTLII